MQHYPDASDTVAELRELAPEIAPRAGLEERTVAALRARGLLRGRAMRWRLRPAGWLAAAGILVAVFLAGFASGRAGRVAPRPEASFALILYGSVGGDSATQMERAAEYGRWARAQHEAGRVVGGEALGDFISAAGSDTVAAGGPEDLVGFFLVQAPDRAAAARLAAGCPHVKYGGRVVVRAIQPT
jgi:hypothetical protein